MLKKLMGRNVLHKDREISATLTGHLAGLLTERKWTCLWLQLSSSELEGLRTKRDMWEPFWVNVALLLFLLLCCCCVVVFVLKAYLELNLFSAMLFSFLFFESTNMTFEVLHKGWGIRILETQCDRGQLLGGNFCIVWQNGALCMISCC